MTGAALENLDLTAALLSLREQEDKHGHTAASDAETPIGKFADHVAERSAELRDVLRPGDRQNLDVAYRRAARLTAYGLAVQRRIRIELSKQRSTDQ